MSDVVFANYQYEIYLAGLAGKKPDLPMDLDALEQRARERMDAGAYGYVAGGASSEDTMRANLEAFRQWRIVPRMLRDVAQRDLRVDVAGTQLAAPVLLAPIGVQSIVHGDGELAVARAAAATGTAMVLSMASSFALEDVAAALGDTPRWFQLYWPKDPDVTVSVLSRAERAGYTALVVTLDTWLLGWRPRDLGEAYLPFLQGIGIANYLSDPAFCSKLARPPEEDPQMAVAQFLSIFSDPTVTWEDLAFLREHTRLPILLKGVLDPEDARTALDHGVDGLVVSNHGGRQVDGAVAALDALPRVASAVDDRIPVLFDSGVRTGSDALKALALGARAVLLGRPYVWGLAVGGEAGVRHVVRGFLADLDLALALSGYTSPGQLSARALTRAGA